MKKLKPRSFLLLAILASVISAAIITHPNSRSVNNRRLLLQEYRTPSKRISTSVLNNNRPIERQLKVEHGSLRKQFRYPKNFSKSRRLPGPSMPGAKKVYEFKYAPGFAGMPFPPFMMNGPHFHPPYNITLNALPTQNWKLLDDKASLESGFAEEAFDEYTHAIGEAKKANQKIDDVKNSLQSQSLKVISDINRLRIP